MCLDILELTDKCMLTAHLFIQFLRFTTSYKMIDYVEVTYGENIKHNTATISYIHDISSLVLGVVAGILGLESIDGFKFFFAATLVIDTIIYVIGLVLSKGKIENYFSNPALEIFLNDYSRTLFSFVMMWTLVMCLIN